MTKDVHRILTYENVKEDLVNYGYCLLDNFYKNIREKMTLIDNLNYKYFTTYNEFYATVILRNGILAKFHSKNPYTIDNIKNWIKIENKNFIFHSGTYTNINNHDIYFKCLVCNQVFDIKDSNLFRNGCPYCRGRKVYEKNSLLYNRPDICEEWNYEKNKDLTPDKVTEHCRKKVWWKCFDNHEWECDICERTRGDGNVSNCPYCKISMGEKKILKYLGNKNIENIQQKKFKECKYKQLLPFDFYLPKYNLCIEFQGPQHYSPVNFWGQDDRIDKKVFEIQKVRDNIKKDFCTKNNISFLAIPYWMMNKIEEILDKELKIIDQ